VNDTNGPASPRRRQIVFQLAAVALVLVSGLAGTGLARWLRGPALSPTAAPAPGAFPNRLFHDWGKPDLVLVLSAQQHGYMLPCGCSHPQVGGLERRYNFLQRVKKAGWPHVAFDLGDVPQQRGPAGLPNQQGMIKYVYSMNALKAMNYTAVGFGEYEVNLGLGNALGEYALNESVPRVIMSNLIGAENNFPEQTKSWELAELKEAGLKVGITAVVGPTVFEKIKKLTNGDPKVRFENTPDALKRVWKNMEDAKVNIPVLLFQGPVTRNAMKRPSTEAVACAEAFPQFPIILCLSEEDEPPAVPVEVTTRGGSKTLVITLGHKGKFIGVVGVFKTGNPANPCTFRYRRVELTEDFLTPEADRKDHPIGKLMESYTRDLKDKNYLELYGQRAHKLQALPEVEGLRKPGQATYVGSEKCKKCHDYAYDVWKHSPHSHAYDTLVKAQHPSNRQYDPECIVCHTVGFGFQTGYVNEKQTPGLKNVGCESCHGPASLHVANPKNPEWQKRINPWKYLPKAKRKDAIDQSCQKCHDIDNDVTWIHGGFEKKWEPRKIAHYTPKPADEEEEKKDKKEEK
jgi:hypothetical protein